MISGIKNIKEAGDLKGKKVVLRLDLNVPIEKGKICDDFRILKALPTVEYLKKAGAIVFIISHLDEKEGDSLLPVAEYLKKLFPVSFVSGLDEAEKKMDEANEGDILLCENIRQYPEEEKNDEAFSKRIATLGDIYVNDAFPASHRKHASIIGVPKFLPHYAGFRMEEEINHLSITDNTPRPFLFILGGAKFDTKLPLIQKFLEKADKVFVCGALANDFFKGEGLEIGGSIVSDIPFDQHILKNPKLVLPGEVMVENSDGVSAKTPSEVRKEDRIMDAGPKALEELSDLIKEAKLVLWNGPLGFYEDGFNKPTQALAKMISEAAAETILGGGDTIAAIQELGLQDKFSFVSTGGGAMLEFLLNDTLPGIEALKN